MHDRDRRVRLHFVLSAELLEAVLFVDDSVLTGGRLGGDERCAVVAHHGIPAGAPPSNRLCQACRMQGVAEGSQHLRKDAQHLPLGKCFAPSCSDHVRQLPARTVPVADMPSPPVVQLVPVAEMPSPPVVQRPIADVQRLASSSVWNNRVRDVPDDVGMRRDLLHHFRFCHAYMSHDKNVYDANLSV
eukprot:3103928-Rhodomonas_salina.7